MKHIIYLGFFFMANLFNASAQLTYRSVLSGKCSLLLPKEFKIMDYGTLTSKYSRNKIKPSEVYTNDQGNVNIAFNLTSQSLNDINVISFAESSAKQLAHMPGVTLVKKEIQYIGGKHIATIEFYSKSIDVDVYNLMFIVSVDGKELLGSFNCTYTDWTQWKENCNKIISSIRVK